MVPFLSKVFNIKATEWPRLLILYLMAMLFIAGITWGGLSVQAVFLFEVGLDTLPQVIVANAVISIIAVIIYTPFVDRVSNDKLLIAISIISAAAIGIGRILLVLNLSDLAYLLLYLLSLVVRQVFNLQWWTYVNAFYDTQSAKRTIPLLTTASRIAVIGAGLSLPLLNSLLSPANIILIWIASLLIVALIAWLMPYLLRGQRRERRELEYPPRGVDRRVTSRPGSFIHNIREGYRFVSQSPFLRWTTLSIFLLMLLFALLTYFSSEIFVQSFQSGEELSSFLGRLSSGASLIMLPVQFFLLSRIVGRIGVGNAYLAFRTITVAISGAIAAKPGLVTAALSYVDEKILGTVFRVPTDNLLYNAVPMRIKGRARAFITGLVAPLGSLVGGAFLLLLPMIPVDWFLRLLIGVSAGAYITSAVFVRSRYTEALISLLEEEDYSFLLSTTPDLSVTDSAAFNRLVHKLEQTTNPDLKVFIAKLISEIGGSEAIPVLEGVAREGDAQFRSTILDIIAAADLRGDAVRRVYTEFLTDPDGRVRRSAIAGLERWAGAGNEQFLALALEMLHDPDFEVKAQVIPPLIQSGDFFYLASAAQTLTQILSDPDPQRRARGVRVLGQVGDERFIRSLAEYLTDEEDLVRIEAARAIESLSRIRIPDQVVPPLMERIPPLLDDPVEQVRRATISVLEHVKTEQARQYLTHFLTDPSPQVREAAVDGMARIGKPIIPILTPALDSEELQRRKMAAVALSRISKETFGHLVEFHVDQDLRTIYRNYDRLETLSPCTQHRSISLLQSGLREQNEQLADEIFYLLAAIHPAEAVEVITESIDSESARVRANATEALESLTSPQMTRLIAPLFDPQKRPRDLLTIREEAWGIPPAGPEKVIDQLITDPNHPLLRAIIAYGLGEIWAAPASEKDSEAEAPSPPKKRRRRQIQTADLFGALTDKEEEQEEEEEPTPVVAPPPSPCQSLLRREEVEAMLTLALEDPVEDVRVAARTALQMMGSQDKIDVRGEEDGKMLSIIERIIFLKEVSFFQSMTVDQLKVLAAICEEEFFPEDAPIFEQGDPGGTLYVVVSGRVALERPGRRKGSIVRLGTVEPRSYFGEMSLFSNDPHSVSALAIQDTLTLRLRREPLIALVRQYPDLSLELINVLSHRLRETSDRIAELSRTRPRELERLYDKLS